MVDQITGELSQQIEMPQEILECAQIVDTWMKKNGHTTWALRGVCSRDHREALIKIKERLSDLGL